MTIRDILYYTWRIIKWNLGDKSPMIADIKLTYRCNLNCWQCPWKNLPKDNEIDIYKWGHIFEKFYKMGVRIAVLEGGEPTLRKDLNELILIAKRIGLKVIVVTNGTNQLNDYEPHLFIVSVDGTEQVYDKIRGKGSFSKVIQNIKNVKKNKLALTTINQLNKDIIKEMLDTLEPYFDGHGFSIMYPYEKKQDSLCLSREEVKNVYKQILDFSDKYTIVNSKGMVSDMDWECTPWMSILCEPTGKWKVEEECFIGHTAAVIDCSMCQLGCYRGFAQLAKGDINSWYLLHKYLLK